MKCFSSAALSVRLVGAFAFVVGMSLSLAAAPVCPFYMYGQMNGIYYYYGQDMANCTTPTFLGASDSRVHQIGASCTMCNDEIKSAAPIAAPEKDRTTAKSKPPVHPAGEYRQTDFIKKDPKKSPFYSAGQHIEVVFDRVYYATDGDGVDRFFRVLELNLTIAGSTDKPKVRVGQELHKSDGEKTRKCTIKEDLVSDPMAANKGYHFRIKPDASSDPDDIFVTTRDKMKM